MFGGFTEGLQLFASFAMLMNFPRFNKMKGMGQIVTWSVRDESLHCEGIIKLFHAFAQERGCLTKAVKDDIIDCCQKTVRLEDKFIDLAFETGPGAGHDRRRTSSTTSATSPTGAWASSACQPIYMIEEHPLPWLAPLLNGVEHANFFETRATEYSKAATKGNWNDVWSSFDQRRNAKAAKATTTWPKRASRICSVGLVERRRRRSEEMADIQEMTDEEIFVHRARATAAFVYRAEGYDWFARRIELGLEDEC